MALVHTDVAWPNGLTVDWEERELYWTDAKANVIEAIGLDGYNRRVVIGGKTEESSAYTYLVLLVFVAFDSMSSQFFMHVSDFHIYECLAP